MIAAAAMFNDLSSPLTLLKTRRSGKARDMVAPGPDSGQLREILSIAARTPDHGKLAPWRLVHVTKEQRAAFADALKKAYLVEKPDAGRLEIEAADQFAHQAPELIIVLSAPKRDSHIPLWEQELSAGAVCMNLLAATHALGFVGCWLTGWMTYSTAIRDLFGSENERIAGFVFLGSPARPLEERPRPALDQVVSEWTPA